MKKIEVKTSKRYSSGNDEVIVFLRHSEDRIEVKNGETVNIDIYNNGELVFSGDKQEFFNKLNNK